MQAAVTFCTLVGSCMSNENSKLRSDSLRTSSIIAQENWKTATLLARTSCTLLGLSYSLMIEEDLAFKPCCMESVAELSNMLRQFCQGSQVLAPVVGHMSNPVRTCLNRVCSGCDTKAHPQP